VSTATIATLGQEMSNICSAEYVVEGPSETVLGVKPAVAVHPGSADEIAAILRFANEHGLSVVPAGGFTQQSAGNSPPQADVLLYTSRLVEVEHYDPGDLTIGVGAGWTVARLSAKVADDKLFFAGDPPLPERATVGGLLATGLYGPHRHGYGGPRDYCIGVRFITGDGRKAKGGGRVVKNVAGYDMMKLLIGSWGTLAIITSASFKLFPAPRQTSTFVSCFSTAAEALEFRSHVLRSPLDPICLELLSPQASELLTPGSPAAALWSVCLRAAGSDAVLARYREELGSALTHEIRTESEDGFWSTVANFAPMVHERHPDSLLMSLALPLSDLPQVLNSVASIADASGLQFAVIGRVGVGHLLVALWVAESGPTQASLVNSLSAVRDRLPRHASMAVLHCPEEARGQITEWLATPTDLESMRAVKQALDRNEVLNRGRFRF
jgi:glycolate dehydrogenase FAD-binding subunit